MKRKYHLIGAAVAATCLIAACGSDSTESTATTAESTATTAESTATTSMTAEDGETIVDLAAGNPDLSTLVTALEAAGLTETLAGDGPFTVFAPTNAAFEALPAGTLDSLLADPQGALTDVLTYHVVSGELKAADVLAETELTTLQGGTLAVDAEATTIGGARITATDIEASNGVVHVIDAVLVPEAGETIVDLAAGNPDLSTLVTALEAAGLTETLAGDGPFTVFAPTNAAFEALPAGTLDSLLADPQGALTDVLTYHVVSGELKAADVLAETELTTLQGGTLAVDAEATTIGGARITATDIEASNGVVHVIDAVLIPSS